jgi:UDP-glucose 6-dehydrogenase
LAPAVAAAEAIFIAVGTPSRRGDGHADLSYVYTAAREIAAALDGFTVIITKSTVPVGTGDEVDRIIRETRPDADFAVVSNPEFLREGAPIQDFKHPDRIVAGADEDRARKVFAEIYRPLYLNKAPILYTSRRTAELIKYAANAFLATKIAFINEMADLAEEVGADVQDVARGDPVGMEHAKAILPDVVYCDGPYTCADGSDGVVIATEWEQFRALDFDLMKKRMACPLLVDLRNIYSSDEMAKHGFLYVGIGRKSAHAVRL